jgi:hypothetical protein
MLHAVMYPKIGRLAVGLAQATFSHSLAAGQEALRISVVNEAVVHFEFAHQLAREALLPKKHAEADLRDLYTLLGRVYQLGGQTEDALAIAAERDRLG